MADDSNVPGWQPVVSQILLFFLFLGLAAAVDVRDFVAKFTDRAQRKGLIAGVCCQFGVMPLLGFLVTKAFALDPVRGTVLLIIASSPGGAFSNWWCALGNADLALSIAMTTTSTVLCLFMLPLNAYIYVRGAFGRSVPVDYVTLMVTVGVVFAGVFSGLAAGTRRPQWRDHLFLLGNVAGLASIILAVAISNTGDKAAPIWSRDATFYLSTVAMSTISIALGVGIPSLLGLGKPQRIAVGIETMYQNLGIAVAASLSMFNDANDAAKAVGVPIFYGVYATVVISLLLLGAWKLGWTYAPPGDPLCQVLSGNYQPVPGTARGEGVHTAAAVDGDHVALAAAENGGAVKSDGQISPTSLQLIER